MSKLSNGAKQGIIEEVLSYSAPIESVVELSGVTFT